MWCSERENGRTWRRKLECPHALVCVLTVLALCQGVWAQNTQRFPVQFDPGRSSKTVTIGIERGGRALFFLEAARGQKFRVICDSPEDNAVFQVSGARGEDLGQSRAKNGRQVFYSVLPSSGNVEVNMTNTRGGSEPTVTFEIW